MLWKLDWKGNVPLIRFQMILHNRSILNNLIQNGNPKITCKDGKIKLTENSMTCNKIYTNTWYDQVCLLEPNAWNLTLLVLWAVQENSDEKFIKIWERQDFNVSCSLCRLFLVVLEQLTMLSDDYSEFLFLWPCVNVIHLRSVLIFRHYEIGCEIWSKGWDYFQKMRIFTRNSDYTSITTEVPCRLEIPMSEVRIPLKAKYFLLLKIFK